MGGQDIKLLQHHHYNPGQEWIQGLYVAFSQKNEEGHSLIHLSVLQILNSEGPQKSSNHCLHVIIVIPKAM